MISSDARQQFHDKGFLVVESVFTGDQVAAFRDHLFDVRRRGTFPGDHVASDERDDDPLKIYPRMLHPHRWDRLTREWLLDDRLRVILTELMGREPFAAQTMVYFKPPGGRGTALHQDNYYLRVHPGTCIAAWIALENADEENGCMILVPGSQAFPLLCVVEADMDKSSTPTTVPLPDDLAPKPIPMSAGDALFFAGQLIHGSLPNTSGDRFRPALACHYVAAEAEQVSQIDRPVLRFDGSEVELDPAPTGGECGVWVHEEDQRRIQLSGESPRQEGYEVILERMNDEIWEKAREIGRRLENDEGFADGANFDSEFRDYYKKLRVG